MWNNRQGDSLLLFVKATNTTTEEASYDPNRPRGGAGARRRQTRCAGVARGELVGATMVKLEWKVNGRTVPSNRIADELGKSIRRAATDKVKTAIAAVRCPVHGNGASDIRVETQGSKMNFTFTACCDGLKQAISTRLR